MTQINNRVGIETFIKSEVIRYQRYKKIFSVIMIDIDHFKKVNDNFGHKIGDDILISIAEILENTIRASDKVGRWVEKNFYVFVQKQILKMALSSQTNYVMQ